tara:strand:- start:1393 stop:2217 length:825 start_codon:yes stop_codon:yes gene_type:complete
MKRIAVIFDLDETIGYFGDVAVFIEAYEKYRNKSISDEELFIVFNTIPELFRKGIFDIFRLLRNFKKNNNDKKNRDDKMRVLIYTNNMGPKTWVYSIKRYIEEKIEYKLFDRVIAAWKVDGKKYEEKRTSHDKKYEDLIEISNELKNYKICFLDDQYHPEMKHEKIEYLRLIPYKYKLTDDEFMNKFLNSKLMKDAEDKKKFKESCEKQFEKRFNIINKVPDKKPKMDKPEKLFKEIKEFVKAPDEEAAETKEKSKKTRRKRRRRRKKRTKRRR